MSIWSKIKGFFSQGWNVTSDYSYTEPSAGLPVGGSFFDGSKYDWGLSSSGKTLTLDHTRLLANARKSFHDQPAAKTVVDRFVDTVVDVGLRLEPTPSFKQLGLTEEQAELWSADVEERFHNWAMNKTIMRDESMNFYQLQRLVELFTQRDNDFFVRLHYSQDRSLSNPLQVSLVDPLMIAAPAYTNTDGYQQFEDGIVRDARGRAIRYMITHWNGKEYKTIPIPAKGRRSGRPLMLHGCVPEYAGQSRGYPRMSHMLQELENLTDFTLSHIKKAIAQSCLTMFTESKDGPASHPFEGISRTLPSAGPAAYEEDGGSSSNITGEGLRYQPVPEASFGVPGSAAVFNLEANETLKEFPNSSPVESYDRFVESFITHLSASVGMPVEHMLMKFGQNYSASRATLILAYRVASIWREELACDLLDPLYEQWLGGEIAAGRISCPGWNDPRLRAAWLQNNWVGKGLPNIDPLKAAQADKEYASIGATTLRRIARDLNGSKVEGNLSRLTKEYESLPTPPWQETGMGTDEGDDNG